MKISTVKLQAMMNKVVKGVGNNKLIPITSLIGITAADNKLTIEATDSNNYLYVTSDLIDSEDFYACVRADQFIKLISKITSDFVSLTICDNFLQVKGNGTYNIELPLDENGAMIVYTDPMASDDTKAFLTKECTIQLSTIKSMLASLRSGLAVTSESPQITNYYVSANRSITTNRFKVNALDYTASDIPEMLISSSMMDILDTITSDVITVKLYADDTIEFITDDVRVFGHVGDGIDKFPVDTLNLLIDKSYSNYCKISRLDLMQTLDRIALFVGAYDNGAITITFDSDAMCITSKQTTGTEQIGYMEHTSDSNKYTICVDIEMLQSQIKSQESDVVTIYYGDDKAIKLTDGNLTFVLALII